MLFSDCEIIAHVRFFFFAIKAKRKKLWVITEYYKAYAYGHRHAYAYAEIVWGNWSLSLNLLSLSFVSHGAPRNIM